MKNILRTIAMMALLLTTVQLRAQITQVYGTVSDDWGPLFGVNVCEMDGTDRIVESAITDLNGNFTMRVKNPKNKIRFSYVGCTTVLLPIDREQYTIHMKSENEITEVVITSQRRINSGSQAKPEREISIAAQTLSTETMLLHVFLSILRSFSSMLKVFRKANLLCRRMQSTTMRRL